ncbi:MAG: ABC transporter ATP-binding protein [Rhodobacterales bacterium]|nr:ABC transporter ATP-binding protein [Rhodobacterales bacterium]
MSGVRIDGLVKQWGTFRAVDGVTFDAPEGTLTVLLGPSGCGKSTILRMIAGLETVDGGQVTIAGQDVTRQDAAKRGVSMVFQSYALFPHLDVRENILFGLKVRRVARDERDRRLADAARMVGLTDLLDRKPAALSGGQRQRVALARTIVANQPVCLMDEPLSNLDAKLRAEMRDEIHALQRALGLTMVYVTHDQTEAMSMADQVVLLKDGRIEQIGPPADLYERPATVFAAQFLGMPPMNVLPLADLDPAAAVPRVAPGAPDAGAGWSLGVRPEKVVLAPGGLAVEVAAVDYMGAETVLRLRHGPLALMARVDGRAEARPGDRVAVSWAAEDLHLFDDTGIRRSGPAAAPPKPG